MKPTCKECGCQTGGGEYCYLHAPYMTWPKENGTFLVDRNGRHRVSFLDQPNATDEQIVALEAALAAAQQEREAYRNACIEFYNGAVGAGSAGLIRGDLLNEGVRLFDEADAAANRTVNQEDREYHLSFKTKFEAAEQQRQALEQTIRECHTECHDLEIRAEKAEADLRTCQQEKAQLEMEVESLHNAIIEADEYE